ncbi:MAG: hypothetical protein ACOYYI_04445 [Chloroflexota bacterium]
MNVFTAKALGLTINMTSTGGYTFNPEVQGQMIDFLPEEANPVAIYLLDTKEQSEAFVDGMRVTGVDPSTCCASPAPEPFKGLHAVIRQIEEVEEYLHDLIDGNNFLDGDIPVIDMTSKKWAIWSPSEASKSPNGDGFWSEDGWGQGPEEADLFTPVMKHWVIKLGGFIMPESSENDARWVNMDEHKRSMMARTKAADGSRELTIEVTVKAPSDVPDSMVAHLVSMLLDVGMADAVATAEDAKNCGHAAKFAEEAVKLQVCSCRPKEIKTSEMIGYWGGDHYYKEGEKDTEGLAFECEIHDQRRTNGQVMVDIVPESGDLDDGLYTTFEINRLNGSKDECPCLHVAFDHDNMAFSLFKQGDKFILRREAGVGIRQTVLPDGEHALIVE